jgi:hypothetical protein
MKNLNAYGRKHLATYIGHYLDGKLSDKAARVYIGSCFNVRGDV